MGLKEDDFSQVFRLQVERIFAVACYLYFTICASEYVLAVVLTTTIHEINKQGKHKLSLFKAVKIVNEGNFTP